MGALKNQLQLDLTAAMKARDEAARSNLRMALAAIHTEEVSGDSARELSDAEELKVIAKEVNKRKDAAAAYTQAGREELADKEASEADFLGRYLPQPLGEDEVKSLVEQEVARFCEGGERPSMRQMGQLVKAVQARCEGRADGRTISTLVKAALQ